MSAPLPAPRDVPPDYIRGLLLSSGWVISAGILSLLGFIFAILGLMLTVVFSLVGLNVPVGLSFVGVGVLLLIVGLPILLWRYIAARQMAKVFGLGEVTSGNVINVQQKRSVRVNRQHPWVISYQFRTVGREYSGHHITFNLPNASLKPGQLVYVLYLERNPERNTLYLL